MAHTQNYTYTDDTGDAQIAVYTPAEGVEVAYVTAHMGALDFGLFETRVQCHYLGIHYCREGRIEQAREGEFLYLMPGDCILALQDRKIKTFSFPMQHYHGISIGLDLHRLGENLTAVFECSSLSPQAIAAAHCSGQNYAILRGQQNLQAFFASLYAVDEAQRATYLVLKLPELFFLLQQLPTAPPSPQMVTRGQVELVKEIANYISTHINEKISLKDLTTHFAVSDTYLQNSFRRVYGMPVISFIRAQKMQSAAQALIHTDRSVGQLAQEFGYENESKFSAAFKKIIGDTPGVYRREHSKISIL